MLKRLRFITGILLGLFIIPPILSFFGIPSFDHLLTSLFGDNNPLALASSVLVILLVIVIFYKKPT